MVQGVDRWCSQLGQWQPGETQERGPYYRQALQLWLGLGLWSSRHEGCSHYPPFSCCYQSFSVLERRTVDCGSVEGGGGAFVVVVAVVVALLGDAVGKGVGAAIPI